MIRSARIVAATAIALEALALSLPAAPAAPASRPACRVTQASGNAAASGAYWREVGARLNRLTTTAAQEYWLGVGRRLDPLVVRCP
jgi:hypothetical protein